MSERLKTWDQLAKEEALLSKIRLCWHAQQGLCNPPNGRTCNFAHWLGDLTLPEEKYGNWSKVWQQGKVDMHCWHSYHPDISGLLLLAVSIRKEVVAESHS